MITDSPADDVYLDGPLSQEDIDVLFHLAVRLWPQGTIQFADEENDTFVTLANAVPPPVTREFFIVKNDEARRAWDARGYSDEYAGTMLYVQVHPDYIQITGDHDGMTVAQTLLDAVKTAREERVAKGVTP